MDLEPIVRCFVMEIGYRETMAILGALGQPADTLLRIVGAAGQFAQRIIPAVRNDGLFSS
jgi:hypothetical protein